MKTVARFQKEQISITGGLHERLPMVLDGLVEHYPFDGSLTRYAPPMIRYIRDHLGFGSTTNDYSHWIEMQVFDEDGNNVALGKPAVNSNGVVATAFTDGMVELGDWTEEGMNSADYLEVDLGEPMRLERIRHWHYYGDARTYHKSRISVSEDGVNWFDIFDSAIEGEYAESEEGHEVYVYAGDRVEDRLGMDGTFETRPLGDATGWNDQLGEGGSTITDEFAYSGTRSLKVMAMGGNRRTYRWFPIKKGEQLTLSAMIHALTPGASVKIELNGGAYGWAGKSSTIHHRGTGWERKEVTYPTQGGALSDCHAFVFLYGVDGVEVHADEVRATTRMIGTRSPLKVENLIPQDEGVVVQPAVENLIRGRAMTRTAGGGQDLSGDYFTKADSHMWYHGLMVPDTDVEAGKTYTFSLDVRCDIPFQSYWDPNVNASNYTGNDAAIESVLSSLTPSYDTPGKWKRFSLTVKLREDVTDGVLCHSFCPSFEETRGHRVYYRDPMLHEGSFPLGYVPYDSDGGRVDFRVPESVQWTVAFRHRPFKPLEQITEQNNSPWLFQVGNYYANASITLWNFSKNLRLYMKGDTSPGWTNSITLQTFTADDWNDREHHYVMVKEDERSVTIYKDGVSVGTVTASEDVTNFDYFSLQGWSIHPTARYRDLSIYDRALTAEEVKQLVASPYSINSGGEMRTGRVIEGGTYIPEDGVLFPLDDLSPSRLGKTEDAEDLFLDEDATAVLRSVLNRAENPEERILTPYTNEVWDPVLHEGAVQPYRWTSGLNSGVTNPEIGYHAMWQHEGMDGNPCIKFINRNDLFGLGKRWLGISMSLGTLDNLGFQVGDKITFSWYQKTDTAGGRVTAGLYHKSVDTGNNTFGYTLKGITAERTDVWERVSFTFEITSDMNRTSNVYIYIYGHYGTHGTTWVDRVMVDNHPLLRPYVNGPDPYSYGQLTYNLNRDLGIDWSQDWSIVYWRKPIGTTTAKLLNGYNIDSLGCNSNSVGGGYIWWGKRSGNDKIQYATPEDLIPDDYFENWRMVSLVKTGTNLTIKEFGRDGTIHVRNEVISTTRANYYVTQYGYDLKLGGWDDTYACNTLFKDLFVVRRALSDAEIERMFDGGCLLSDDTIRVRNGIQEGALL